MRFNLPTIKRKLRIRLWSLCLFTFILLWFYPISYGLIRLAKLVLAVLIYSGLIYLSWHRYLSRLVVISLGVILSLFLLMPGKAFDIVSLQNSYTSQLQKYENTYYIWGGENRVGIDCSGLVRQGLIQANFRQGIRTLNPGLVRQGFDIWWHDSSAEALRDEYRDYTKKILLSESINQLDYAQIQPGDMAVTQDGLHILAYLGQKYWIEADPLYKKVLKITIPERNNPWFNTPVYLLRWRLFIKPKF